MALRYTKLSSTLKVDLVGAVTLSGTTDIAVVDLTASPYAHGIRTVMLVLQNGDLDSDATVVARGNTTAAGDGTDTTLATMVVPAGTAEKAVLEIPAELLGHFSDRSTDGYFKSIVFDIDGNDTDTIDAAVVAVVTQEEDGLTPTDVTTVS